MSTRKATKGMHLRGRKPPRVDLGTATHHTFYFLSTTATAGTPVNKGLTFYRKKTRYELLSIIHTHVFIKAEKSYTGKWGNEILLQNIS